MPWPGAELTELTEHAPGRRGADRACPGPEPSLAQPGAEPSRAEHGPARRRVGRAPGWVVDYLLEPITGWCR